MEIAENDNDGVLDKVTTFWLKFPSCNLHDSNSYTFMKT